MADVFIYIYTLDRVNDQTHLLLATSYSQHGDYLMNKTSRHITYHIENSIHDVINEARGAWGGVRQDNEIQFKRIVYSKDHNLVVVEIDRDELPCLPEKYFDDNNRKDDLLARTMCSKLDIVNIGKSYCFYFWLAPSKSEKLVEVESVAYAI
jgi:hypothetical protein